ncbi:MAG: hypothetical protein LQ338_007149 [Usnochroma carphineum]|nr:MAG: hypothetical protein LQ338_007149 [Usnochroma carphineum]
MSSSNSPSKPFNLSRSADPNHAAALSKAFGKPKSDVPEPYAGELRDQSNANVAFGTFNIHTPPDITSNTRIIACLGLNQDTIKPNHDGWFLSDFMAFWHIFNGLTKHQTWLHCLNLDAVVQAHTRYLHGNPYKQRKVVLDGKILQETKKTNHSLQGVSELRLCSRFKAAVKEQCKAAEKAGEDVLVLLFGHGDSETRGISLGSTKMAFKKSQIQFAMKGIKTKVTLVTTQCYGGGWTCSPAINFSALTAAGKDTVSRSWRRTASTGRACGSTFATAIIQKLTQHPVTNKSLVDVEEDEESDDPPIEPTKEQQESYTQFCGSFYESLLRDIDRRGITHGMTFLAEDDAWSMCWSERTGIPLAAYKQRWERLQDWGPDVQLHPGGPFNRDPNVSDEVREEYRRLDALDKQKYGDANTFRPNDYVGSTLGKRKTTGLYGGSVPGLIATVKALGADYVASDAGNEDTAKDGPLHSAIQWITDDKETSVDEIEWALRCIQYRMGQQANADRYLKIMELAQPMGKPCCDFDASLVLKTMQRDKYCELLRLVFTKEEIIFPRPISFERQGHPFYKGHHYLIAAFDWAGLSKDSVIQKLDMLARTVDDETEQATEMIVMRDQETQVKRRRLFDSYGRRGAM